MTTTDTIRDQLLSLWRDVPECRPCEKPWQRVYWESGEEMRALFTRACNEAMIRWLAEQDEMSVQVFKISTRWHVIVYGDYLEPEGLQFERDTLTEALIASVRSVKDA